MSFFNICNDTTAGFEVQMAEMHITLRVPIISIFRMPCCKKITDTRILIPGDRNLVLLYEK